MTTDYKQMKHLVEKAGRKWHDVTIHEATEMWCEGCQTYFDTVHESIEEHHTNPSPHSVDDLLELAKELKLTNVKFEVHDSVDVWTRAFIWNSERIKSEATEWKAWSYADALRLAMCRATGWKE